MFFLLRLCKDQDQDQASAAGATSFTLPIHRLFSSLFTRLPRALTFLNEKALFAAPQQLTIYDNEASAES